MDFNSFDDSMNMQPILTSDLDLFLSELNILFSTERGSILGRRSFGHSIEQLLWKTTYNEEFIKSDIENQILNNCLMHEFFVYSVNFQVAEGISRDEGYLTIEIKNRKSSAVIANPQWFFK